MHFLTVWNSWLRQQISEIPSLSKGSLSFYFNDEGKQAVKTKAECFKAWRLFLFSSLSLSNMHYWPSVKSMTGYIWPNSFFSLLLDFLKVLYFLPRWLCHETSSFARFLRGLMHWSSLRSLLRTYKRSTCSKSSILFTKTMSGPMKKRTTPIYATCTSPIMYLICPSKLNIMVMQNLRRGGGGGGQIRCIMWDLQVANPAILTEQAWSIKDLFHGQIIVLLIHNGLSCCYLVSSVRLCNSVFTSRSIFR